MHKTKGRIGLCVCALILTAFSLTPHFAAAAPRLVVMAVNSGSDFTAPYNFDPPQLTPGAKGFLIGLDTGDVPGPLSFALGDLVFHGPGLINLNGVDLDDGILASPPKIMTRSEATAQGLIDGVNYRRDDTYLLDQAQATSEGSRSWVPIGPGYEGGSHDDTYIRVTSGFRYGNTPQGVWPMMYVVTTGDLAVSGTIAFSQDGFDLLGNFLGPTTAIPGITAMLDFAAESIQPTTIPTGQGILLGCDTLGRIYNVDRTTGVLDYTRLTGVERLAGIAFSPQGALYGVSSAFQGSASQLFQIEHATGVATGIGNTGVAGLAEGDIEFNPQDGLMYCVSSQYDLFTINTSTGKATLVGAIGGAGDLSAMAFTPDGVLYVLDQASQTLLTINPDDGATLGGVPVPGIPGTTAGMEFDLSTGKLLVVTGGSLGSYFYDALYLLDPATGMTTYIGRSASSGMSGLAFTPVPEPSSLMLAGAALAGLAIYARRHGLQMRNPSRCSQASGRIEL